MRTRILLLIAFFQLATLAFGQKYEIWGVTQNGGSNMFGSVFKVDSNANNLTTEYSFELLPKHRDLKLMQASNGKFYGMDEPQNSQKIIYEYDYSINKYSILYKGGAGSYPFGELIQANNGKLYGLTSLGGTLNKGVLFEFDLTTNTFLVKVEFNGTNGSKPYGTLVQASNGKMYGLTTEGGTTNNGVLFEYNLVLDTLIKKVDFNGSLNGAGPKGKLIEATNGDLYGVTFTGGTSNLGTLFSYNILNNTLSKLVNFIGTNGANPVESPMQASNGKLYGFSSKGGLGNDEGVLYEYDILTNVYSVKKDLTLMDGAYPEGVLVEMTNGSLYGFTPGGGGGYRGVLFEFNYLTNAYIKKLDFQPWTNFTTSPLGSFIKVSPTKLLGCGSRGGFQVYGTLFEYDVPTDSLTPLLVFDEKYFGANPSSNLVQANNGMLYGTTDYGGVENNGLIYELNPYTNQFKDLYRFEYGSYYAYPRGEIVVTQDRKIYGIVSGSLQASFSLYEYDIDLDTFSIVNQFGTNDVVSLLFQHSNGFIYGIKRTGGSVILFRYNIQTKTVQNIAVLFSYSTEVRIIKGPNGLIYGVSSSGGAFNSGDLFSFNLSNNTKTILHSFNTNTGGTPKSNPVIASNGKLYGQTRDGGANGLGVLYEFDIVTNNYNKKIDLNTNGTTASILSSGLAELNSGKLYGYTYFDGIYNKGALFEYNIGNNTIVNKQDFGGTGVGYNPIGTPIKIADCLLLRDTVSLTSCQRYISSSGRYTWTQSGTYIDTIAKASCDSVLTINLTISNINNTISPIGASTIAANAFGANYQWLDCNNNYAIIPNETGQLFTPSQIGYYAVEVTANGCIDTSTCYPITVVGISENQLSNNLAVFPNPTNSNVTLSLGGMYGAFTTQVYNVYGMLINESAHQSTNQVEVELGESEGIYFIHLITSSGEKIVRKVVKN
jgi:uncharacterized repeat protein (TIGR03803 family)